MAIHDSTEDNVAQFCISYIICILDREGFIDFGCTCWGWCYIRVGCEKKRSESGWAWYFV